MDKAALALHDLDGGAPLKLTKSLAKQICATIATSPQPVSHLCTLNPAWPSYDELRQYRERLPWFRNMLDVARREQADFLAQDCMALEQQMLEREEPAMPWVQARKVVMENRRWYTSKVYRAVYGEDPTLNVATQVNVSVPPDKLASIRERLEAARELVSRRDQETPVLEDTPPATDTQSAESPSKVASAVPSAAGEENPTSADLPPWSSG